MIIRRGEYSEAGIVMDTKIIHHQKPGPGLIAMAVFVAFDLPEYIKDRIEWGEWFYLQVCNEFYPA